MWSDMGIRSKLLFPLVFLGVAVSMVLHLYWLPRFIASEETDLRKQELTQLQLLGTSLVPALLSGDLAQIHATLDDTLTLSSSWQAVHLKAGDGHYLYPAPAPAPGNNTSDGNWLNHTIEHQGVPLAELAIHINIQPSVTNRLQQLRNLESLLLVALLLIIVIAALLQEHWIRNPLKLLVTATSRIAHGDFIAPLPGTSRDEMGALVSSIRAMRDNLSHRELTLSRQHELLEAIRLAQSRFIRDVDAKALFDQLLSDILRLTESEYGFIGEVLYRDGNPYLRTFAISNIAWNDETQCFYEENAPRGMEFTNLNTLFGSVITGGKPVVSNQPATDPRRGGIPQGHPELKAFLGIPLLRNDKPIGMYGLANRPDGYDQSLIDFLQPITSTCSHIVEGLKADRQRAIAEDQLRERETRMRTIFENVVDGIITTNEKGIIESFNHAAETMFGYSCSEVIGKNVAILIPKTHSTLHDRYIAQYLNGKKSRIIGTGREVEGVRKDGTQFPLDIAVNEMWLGQERFFCSIMRDITERKKIDRMKDEFVSTVSHELRTPLTSIRGSLSLLASGVIGPLSEQGASLLDIAGKNTERLLLLINDILDIEKFESGLMQFHFTRVAVDGFLEQALKANEAYARQNNVSFEFLERNTGYCVHADPDRLMQVMNNLLSNAAKFSPAGSTIEVSQSLLGDRVRISVTDHGPGIPIDFQPKLFEKFTQLDASDSRKIGGTGLGLSIAKAIIDAHGGDIHFVTQPDIGTTFYFELPALAHKHDDESAVHRADYRSPVEI